MNTKINYMYRDADNYKKHQGVVVIGELSEDQIKDIYASCDEYVDENSDPIYFIPAQVGLPEERFKEITEADHCWFEMGEIALTDDKPTEMVTADEVFKNFMEAKEKGWDDVGYAPSIADNEEIKSAMMAPEINEEILENCLYELYKQSWLYKNVPAGEQMDVLREYEKQKILGETSAETLEDYLWETDGYHGSLYVCKGEFLAAEYLDRGYIKALLTGGTKENVNKIMEAYDYYMDLEKEEIER